MHYSLLDDRESDMNIENNKSAQEDLELNKFLIDEESDGSCACVKKLSNQTVLIITCALFALFVVAEIIGALVRNVDSSFVQYQRLYLKPEITLLLQASNSLSLLGDAAAMSVDVFTVSS